ncbi:TMV resistance protein [Nymphaea thermarum]|nr:TMV resistance protein [Nymphaea thermarum]
MLYPRWVARGRPEWFSPAVTSDAVDAACRARRWSECTYTLKVVEKTDVYSYKGVGGKLVNEFGDGVDIFPWLRKMMDSKKEGVLKILDPELRRSEERGEMNNVLVILTSWWSKKKMVIFAALFIVMATILFGAFHQRIKNFLREDVLGTLLRQLSGNQGIDGGIRGDTEAGEGLEPLTPLSSSSTTRGFEFEVFLSFRGEDTRKGFTGHLYEGLELRGVSTFMDSDKLERGEDINKLFEYIERSKICIPIFSKRYADSTWCLKEVTKSVECGKEIVPVFFGVEPSDVRYQNGPFKSAFEKHESNKKLNQEEFFIDLPMELIPDTTLMHLNPKIYLRDEAELKRAIIKRVLSKVNKKPLEVAKHPVGIETRIGHVRKMLENVDTNGVHVLGIHVASCFLSNIREKSAQPSGLVALQEQLISDVLMVQDIPLSDVAQGKVLIKERANRKGVLLILDDIDSIEQLDALAGGRDWFGSGSVIIITTRDEKALLSCNMKVKQHEIYKPQELNEDESLELFMHHAFNDVQPHGEYLHLSNEVVEAAGGLPLTLEVLGSLLTCDMDVQQWKDVLEKLKRIPPGKVQQRLKLSYDSLDDMEKKIFLDISCFFIGFGRETPTYMWESCGWFPNYAIKVPVTIDAEGMDLMSDEIKSNDKCVSAQCFEEMPNMRYFGASGSLMKLEIEKASIKAIPDSVGALTKLCELIVVDCVHLNVLPDSICWLSSLRVLNLDFDSGLGSLPERLGDMGSLREFDLRGTHIDKIPDSIGELKNLHKLLLSGCARLSRLPDSICLLSTLEILDLEDCLLLASLPERLGDMGALRKLKLSSTSIDKIPDSIRDMEALKKLDLSWTLIPTIPDSIGLLSNLRELSLEGSQLLRELPDSICQLSLLKSLSLEGCYGLYTLPERLGDMEKLEELILDNTRIEIIPDSVGQLKSLRLLSLQGCKLLKALPNSIRELCSLRELKISGTNLRGFENDICHLVAINELTSSSSELLGLCDQSHKAIRHLHLIDAAIEELPDCVGRMENLEELLLECEMLRALPNWIERFSKKLTELEIRSKLLKTLPDCIGSLKQLKQLTLECDNLKALPDSIGSLENMLWLNLDCENLEALPDSVGRLRNIRTLTIGSYNLKALPNSIMSLGRVERFHLYCLSLEAIPDFIGGWKHLHDFTVWSSSLKALPDSIGSLKGVRVLELNCKNLEMLPDSIGELELLSYFKVFSHGLKYLPNSIRSLTRIEFLILECVNLEALSDSMETLQSLVHLGLHCDNFTAPPDFIGRLENLMVFSFKSKNLKHLHATTCVPLGRLKHLSLSGCENLEDLADASTQQSGLAYLTSLQTLHLVDCKRLEYLPQLPSSLLLLDASRCISLRKTSEVSNLTTLMILNLGCCKLLEDVPGLENIATNLQVLELPGPCGFTESCHLRHDFKNKVSKEITFETLKSFKMSGSLVEGSATGQQQLHFIVPKFSFSWLRRARLCLHLDKVLSPIHIAIIANDIIVFEKIAEVEGDRLNLDLSDESIVSTGQEEHCYTIQVTVDVSQLQNVWAGGNMLPEHTSQDIDEPEAVANTSLDNIPPSSEPSDPPIHNRFSGQVYSRRSVSAAAPRKSHRERHPIDRWVAYAIMRFESCRLLGNGGMDQKSHGHQWDLRLGVGSGCRRASPSSLMQPESGAGEAARQRVMDEAFRVIDRDDAANGRWGRYEDKGCLLRRPPRRRDRPGRIGPTLTRLARYPPLVGPDS